MANGAATVVIDNTNIDTFSMRPYVRMVRHMWLVYLEEWLHSFLRLVVLSIRGLYEAWLNLALIIRYMCGYSLRQGVEHGYTITLQEPTNAWRRDPAILVTKCTHGVPLDVIESMHAKFNNAITVCLSLSL